MKEKKAQASKKAETIKNGHKRPLFLTLSDSLLSSLNARSKEIVQKRFGLLSGQKETLDKIGKHYGITRERVRQIISEALKHVSYKVEDDSFLEAEEKIIFTISQNDGIIKVSEVIEKFNSNGQEEANAIKFFALCSKKIKEAEEKSLHDKIWVVSENILEEAKKILLEAEKIINQEKKLFTDSEIIKRLSSAFSNMPESKILNFLKTSANIKKNKFNKWGIKHWPEVSPKGTREKVHLILKEHNRPLHFVDIAGLIDKFELGKRKAHPQTVHNELIKDERFILIGRGIYALKEWGYSKGTIQDVVKKILSESGKPLKKEEIVEKVLKVRKVKKTTITINLNNSEIFEKKNGAYTLRQQ